ncbi:MAG TPA: hydroxymethylglutaryl-CoA synthase, partial [Acidimicrobiaceae bacterium]|nr:hydroxymethylglutaryl-CoA synthase [Actinomycetota bacterium]HAN07084.1 hydroxymethylglutaryl-CoA synthase [Acidimicrobiaceae bacterium]
MRGIIGYGAYVPYYRLDRSKIAAAMGAGGGRGQRSVASFDEDTTTMGVEAARNALRNAKVSPTSILFATANPAYLDKTNATAIQAALDLPQETWAVDTGGSARSAEAAMRGARGSEGIAMAILSDLRTGKPTSADESNGGDAAVAFLFGDEGDSP